MMHDALDLLRTAVARVASSTVVGALVKECESAGADYEQIIGACAAGLAMRDRFACETERASA